MPSRRSLRFFGQIGIRVAGDGSSSLSGASGIWNTWNLYDLASYSVAPLTEAVIVLFRAAMVDVLTEAQKRRLLTDSGELARWERVCEETPEDEEVLYPGLPASGEFLMKLAVSAQRSEKRAEDARRNALQKAGIDGGAGEPA